MLEILILEVFQLNPFNPVIAIWRRYLGQGLRYFDLMLIPKDDFNKNGVKCGKKLRLFYVYPLWSPPKWKYVYLWVVKGRVMHKIIMLTDNLVASIHGEYTCMDLLGDILCTRSSEGYICHVVTNFYQLGVQYHLKYYARQRSFQHLRVIVGKG